MNFGTLRNISKFNYKMKNQSLQIVKHHPYLGVELSGNMKYNLHYIDSITSNASRVLGFVKRNIRHCPKVVKERAYQSLVCPKLEYSSTTWNPQQVTQKRQIEQEQRNAAHFVSNKPLIGLKLLGLQRYANLTIRYVSRYTYRDTEVTIRYVSRYIISYLLC